MSPEIVPSPRQSKVARPGRGRRWLRRLCLSLLVLFAVGALLVIVCRSTIGWFYPIGSGSMEPTLMTGESVFLVYDTDPLERYDIVAFTDAGGGASIKRAFGLPGDRIQVNAAGDVRINYELIPEGAGRPAPTPIFDSRLQPVDEHWRHGGEGFDPWNLEPGQKDADGRAQQVWHLNGSLVARGGDQGLLRFQDRITSGRLHADGSYEHGPHTVHDVIVEFEVNVREAGGYLRVQLSEQGDLFVVFVPVYEGVEDSNILMRRDGRIQDDGAVRQEFLASMKAPIPVGEWITVRMSNVDNRVKFEIAGRSFQQDYATNAPRVDPRTGLYDRSGKVMSVGERVKLGANGLVIDVRNIRVLRDYHIVPRGDYGVNHPIVLGVDEFFVLGDNSGASRDSRDRGPINIERLIGKGRAVVRPLKNFRWL